MLYGSVSIRNGHGSNLCTFVFSVARSQSDSDAEVSETVEDSSDLGIVGEDVQDFGDGNFSPAPGIDTVSVFPKNSARCKDCFQ